MEFTDKNVLVVGAGKSGIAAAKLLHHSQAYTILYDANETIQKEDIIRKLPDNFCGEIILGELNQSLKTSIDYVILSPGVPTDLDYVNEFRDKKVPILGEIELAYYFSKGKVAAITGTNGKTTTTSLVGEIMKNYYSSVFVVGNIGIPYTDMVTKTTTESITVAEMSSFQLETVINFRPDVSAILNITPDHLNRHHTMEAYIDAKMRITMNQTKNDYCILNYEDDLIRKAAASIKTNVIWFSSKRELSSGLYLRNDDIIYNDGKKERIICNVHELHILGRHNHENVMAAVGMSIVLGVPYECIHKALVVFKGIEHRCEYVAQKHGVKYYNDSKGTNPDASIQAIKAMHTKTILIAGGYDKGNDYDEWINAFDGKVNYLVLLGQTRDKIKETAEKMGIKNIVLVDSLKEAVDFCEAHAKPGESVLLSPCCASWGMFKNYEERGNMFKDYVNAINE